MRWTILKPTGFMQNFFEAAPAIARGLLPHATGEDRVSYVDTNDVAAVAYRILTEDGHDGATYYLTGPEALNAEEVATRLSIGVEQDVRPVPLSADDMMQRLRAAGLSEWRVDGVMAQYSVIAGCFASDVTEEVRRLTGQAPRTFVEFVRSARSELAR